MGTEDQRFDKKSVEQGQRKVKDMAVGEKALVDRGQLWLETTSFLVISEDALIYRKEDLPPDDIRWYAKVKRMENNKFYVLKSPDKKYIGRSALMVRTD